MMFKRKILLIIAIFFIFLTPNLASAETNKGTPSTNKSQTSVQKQETIEELKLKIDFLEKRLEDLGSTYQVAITTTEIVSVVITIFVTGVSLLFGFFGIKMVRNHIQSQLEVSIKDLTAKEVTKQIEPRATQLIEEWEEKFAQKYREYSDLR